MAKIERAFTIMHRIGGDTMVTLVAYWTEELLSEHLITASQARDIKMKLNKEFSEVLDKELKAMRKEHLGG